MTHPSDSKEAAQLLACIFCGSADTRMAYNQSGYHYGFCHECHCEGPPVEDNREAAIAAWNRRIQPQTNEVSMREETQQATQKTPKDVVEMVAKAIAHRKYKCPWDNLSIPTQHAYIARAKAAIAAMPSSLPSEREKRLVEALEFYADETNYFGKIIPTENGVLTLWEINADGGMRARKALTNEGDAP